MALLPTSPTITGTTFTGNSAGALAGALYLQGSDLAAAAITTSTFTGNSLTGASKDISFSNATYPTNGAAICVDPNASTCNPSLLTMHYSRIHDNTGGDETGLAIGCTAPLNSTTADATVNVTDNWCVVIRPTAPIRSRARAAIQWAPLPIRVPASP